MYYPKEYHYVQEIQKFNVADYRPRYFLSRISLMVEWNNSRKQFAKYVKYNECGNNEVTLFHKPTKVKCDLSVHTILPNIVESMEK